jgi:D-3-phosphoglycerate dehydrogenase
VAKYRVLVTDFAWPDLSLERAILAKVGAELVVSESQDPDRLAELAEGVDAILVCWAPATEAVIKAATQCRIVSRMGIGLDNIDVAYCTKRGIPVTNVPDYCVVEVAEHTLALVFALARGVGHYHLACQRGEYNAQAGPQLRRVQGSSLGIVGLGRIGKCVAGMAVQLGMQVLGCSRSPLAGLQGVKSVGLDELLVESDFVTLHLPLSSETHHLIGRAEIAKMRPMSYLVNTSRGPLVDHAALAEALAEEQLGGAALDVQDPEPPPLDQPPFNDPRVIVTPHVAFVSDQSVAELRQRAAGQVAARLSGEIPENVVNPSVL